MKILTNPHTYTILLLAGPLTAHQRAVALIRLGPGVAAHAGPSGSTCPEGPLECPGASDFPPRQPPQKESPITFRLTVHREQSLCTSLVEHRNGIGALGSFTAPATSQRTKIGPQLLSTCHLPA